MVRVWKLRRLGSSMNPNSHEAVSAREMARVLIERYQLTTAELEAARPFVSTAAAERADILRQWGQLQAEIQEAFGR